MAIKTLSLSDILEIRREGCRIFKTARPQQEGVGSIVCCALQEDESVVVLWVDNDNALILLDQMEYWEKMEGLFKDIS